MALWVPGCPAEPELRRREIGYPGGVRLPLANPVQLLGASGTHTIKERAFTLVDRPWAVERPYAILVLPLVDATRSFCVGWHRKASSAPGGKPAPGRARSHKYAGRRVRPHYLDDVA